MKKVKKRLHKGVAEEEFEDGSSDYIVCIILYLSYFCIAASLRYGGMWPDFCHAARYCEYNGRSIPSIRGH